MCSRWHVCWHKIIRWFYQQYLWSHQQVNDSITGRSKLIPKNAIVVKLSFIFMDRFSNNCQFHWQAWASKYTCNSISKHLGPPHGHTTKGIWFQIQLLYKVTIQLAKNSKKLTQKGEVTLEKSTFLQKFPNFFPNKKVDKICWKKITHLHAIMLFVRSLNSIENHIQIIWQSVDDLINCRSSCFSSSLVFGSPTHSVGQTDIDEWRNPQLPLKLCWRERVDVKVFFWVWYFYYNKYMSKMDVIHLV